VIVLTADHGMNAKVAMDGTPDVIYLQDWFDELAGRGIARVILPITDPYVVHHGALGSFATVYLPEGTNGEAARKRLAALKGMELVLDARAGGRALRAAARPHRRHRRGVRTLHRHRHFGLAPRPLGLEVPLRSHGGMSEQRVPLIVNRKPLPGLDRNRRFRNFDAFDLALNYAQ
jgi:phosphonoacetate hydrolase